MSLVCYIERALVLLQRDAIVGHAEAIRTQSREPSKAHTHKKRQPTNAGQPHSTRRKEAAVVSSLAACVAPNWGVASLRRVLCCWPALVGWRFLCAFGGFLLYFLLPYAFLTIASLFVTRTLQWTIFNKMNVS